MDLALVASVVSVIIAIAAAFLGRRYYLLLKILAQVAELIDSVVKSLEDGKITEEEIKHILSIVRDIASELSHGNSNIVVPKLNKP